MTDGWAAHGGGGGGGCRRRRAFIFVSSAAFYEIRIVAGYVLYTRVVFFMLCVTEESGVFRCGVAFVNCE